MPRKPREDVAGAIHHVWARGVRRHEIYADDFDRLRYLVMLGRVVVRQGWRCLAYCLMGNHVHLVLETPEANLASGMQRLHGDYAVSFNQRHGLSGHVFQGRYGSERAIDDAQLWSQLRYVPRNPVEAGLCSRPQEWRWSSHRAVVEGGGPAWLDVARTVELFSGAGGDPLERYVEFVGR
jgi:REP element-mobilizing transposase RayT